MKPSERLWKRYRIGLVMDPLLKSLAQTWLSPRRTFVPSSSDSPQQWLRRRSWNLPKNPTEVTIQIEGPFGEKTSRGLTPAQKKGLKFQQKLKAELLRQLPAWKLYDGPWLSYSESLRGQYWAQPDFVLLSGQESGLLVEAKLTRCLDAEIQLEQQYLPLARLAWPGRTWRRVAVCHFWAGEGTPDFKDFPSVGPDRFGWMHMQMRSL